MRKSTTREKCNYPRASLIAIAMPERPSGTILAEHQECRVANSTADAPTYIYIYYFHLSAQLFLFIPMHFIHIYTQYFAFFYFFLTTKHIAKFYAKVFDHFWVTRPLQYLYQASFYS